MNLDNKINQEQFESILDNLKSDLDGSDSKQLEAVFKSVRDIGGSKKVLIASDYIKNLQKYRDEYPNLLINLDYENLHENFGCSCSGLAHEGMAVLSISKLNSEIEQ